MISADVNFYAKTLGFQSKMKVLYPEPVEGIFANDLHLERTGKTKVLFLLHGMGGDRNWWIRYTDLENNLWGRNLTVVIPSAHISWYSDMKYGYRYYTFITEELPELVRELLPNVSLAREDTYIAGVSMGGYGAMKCALSRPDLYSRCGAFSGMYDIVYEMHNPKNTPDEIQVHHNIFGTEEEYLSDPLSNLYLLPEKKASDPQKSDFWMCCGTKDFVWPSNQIMTAKLRESGYSLEYNEGEAGHSCGFWNQQLPLFMEWLFGEEVQ